MKKKLFISVMVLVFLSGCWGHSELRDVAIVSGVGIDVLSSERIKVTTEVLKPGDIRKGNPEPYIVTDAEGVTVFEAVRDFIISEGKKALWTHVNVLIIGKETAEKDVSSMIGFLLRDHEPRGTMKVFVTEGTAGNMMHVKTKQGPTPTMAIGKAIEEQKNLSKAPVVEFHDFVQALFSATGDAFTPIIRKTNKGFEIYGTAIFKKTRMIGKLSSKETHGFLRAIDKFEGGLQVITLPSEKKGEPLHITLEIKESKTKRKVTFIDNKPKIDIEIHEIAFIGSETGRLSLDKKQYVEINKAYQEAIKREVKESIDKVQKKLQTNVLGFDHLIMRKNKKYWAKVKDQWDTLYPSIDVEIKVTTEIPEEGLIKGNVVKK